MIIGKTVTLKEPSLDDYENIKNIWENYNTMKDVGGIIKLPEEKFLNWFKKMIEDGKESNKYFLIFDNKTNHCIGEVSFHRYDKIKRKADLNIKILYKYRGKGKAKESLDLLLDYYFFIWDGLILQDKISINNKNGLNKLLNYGFKEITRNNQEVLIMLNKKDYLVLRKRNPVDN